MQQQSHIIGIETASTTTMSNDLVRLKLRAQVRQRDAYLRWENTLGIRMPRFRMLVEYDGTRFAGWQVQKGEKTVQGSLISAARSAFGDVGEVMGSGRTDSGVHALGQVVHIDIDTRLAPQRLQYAINDNLTHDINVLSIAQAQPRFHARHDAVMRSYIYQIARRRTAFGKPFVWWVRDTLDIGAMRRVVPGLVGGHDYRAYTDMKPSEGSMLVVVDSVDIAEQGDMILIRIRASHFLRKMVRRVVGALVEVGRGNLSPGDLTDKLEVPEAGVMSMTAPPSGLFLEAVAYKGDRLPAELRAPLSIGR